MMPYLEQHRPENQELLNDKNSGRSVPLYPKLPADFYTAPLEERDPRELEDWLDRPFIRTVNWADREASYRQDRAQGFPAAYYEGHWSPDWWAAEGDDAAFEETLAELKARWFATFPNGSKYCVWVLSRDVMWSGGDNPDRHPVGLLGCCANIDDAVRLATATPNSDGYYDAEINGLRVQHWEFPTPVEEY